MWRAPVLKEVVCLYVVINPLYLLRHLWFWFYYTWIFQLQDDIWKWALILHLGNASLIEPLLCAKRYSKYFTSINIYFSKKTQFLKSLFLRRGNRGKRVTNSSCNSPLGEGETLSSDSELLCSALYDKGKGPSLQVGTKIT